jgi:voltage-gated potassium channel
VTDDTRTPEEAQADAERDSILHDLEEWLEKPMIVLSFIWLALFVVEFTRGLTPGLLWAGGAIWVLFILDFGLRLGLASRKRAYLRRNWLTAVSLLVPALRVLRVAQALRVLRFAGAVRGARLVTVVGSLNRGMRALGRTFERRGFGYVVALTLIVTFGGAAGIYAFERGIAGSPITSYLTSLWWTAMVMTTMGTEYYPQSAEGRALCLLLAVYAFAMFGYVTATLATFFIGQDAEDQHAEVAGQRAIDELVAEVRLMRAHVELLGGAGGAGSSR